MRIPTRALTSLIDKVQTNIDTHVDDRSDVIKRFKMEGHNMGVMR